MADNERDRLLEEASTNEDGSEVTKKGLSKPTLIKIAIGVVILLVIAAGAYYFFMSSNEPAQQENSIEESVVTDSEGDDSAQSETSATDDSPLSKRTQLLELREAAVTLKEENLRMKARLMELEGPESLNAEASPAEDGEMAINAEASAVEDGEMAVDADTAAQAKAKKKSQYSNLYTRDSSPVRDINSKPPPEPKWGKFDPLYRGK